MTDDELIHLRKSKVLINTTLKLVLGYKLIFFQIIIIAFASLKTTHFKLNLSG